MLAGLPLATHVKCEELPSRPRAAGDVLRQHLSVTRAMPPRGEAQLRSTAQVRHTTHRPDACCVLFAMRYIFVDFVLEGTRMRPVLCPV